MEEAADAEEAAADRELRVLAVMQALLPFRNRFYYGAGMPYTLTESSPTPFLPASLPLPPSSSEEGKGLTTPRKASGCNTQWPGPGHR